jgi:hypothetical protein
VITLSLRRHAAKRQSNKKEKDEAGESDLPSPASSFLLSFTSLGAPVCLI